MKFVLTTLAKSVSIAAAGTIVAAACSVLLNYSGCAI